MYSVNNNIELSNMAKKDSRLKIAPVVEDFNQTFDTSKVKKIRCSFCHKKLKLDQEGSDSFYSLRYGTVCETCALRISQWLGYISFTKNVKKR